MNTDNTYKDIEVLISKYLSGEIQQKEQELLDSWLAKDPENRKTFEAYKLLWGKTKNIKPVENINVEAAWNRFENSIAQNEEKHIPEGKVFSLFRSRISRIAAVILILIATGLSFYLYNHLTNPQIQLATNSKEIQTVELPDGTKVTLNVNSRFEYRKKLNKETRKVYLEGEAFFEVAHDPSRPFTVKTTETSVTVLGTKFNVNTLSNTESVEVIVNSGKVAFETQKGNDKVILEKGDLGNYSKTKKSLMKSANNDPNYLSWKTKHLIFENHTLQEIISKLNQVYHVSIQIESPGINDCRMTAIFKNQPLIEILEVIKLTLDLEMAETNTGFVLSGKDC